MYDLTACEICRAADRSAAGPRARGQPARSQVGAIGVSVTALVPNRPRSVILLGWRAELFSARPVVEGLSAMLISTVWC